MKNKDILILSLMTFFYFITISLAEAVPIFFLIILFLIPCQYIALGVIRDKTPVFVSLLMQGLIVSFVNFEYSIIIFFLGIFSVIMTEMIKKGVSFGKTIAVGALVIFAFFFASLILTGTMDYLNSPEYKEIILEETGKLVGKEIVGISKDELQSAVKLGIETALVLLPTFLIITAFVLSGFNYYLSLSLLRRREPDDIRFKEKFSDFRLPSDFMLGVLLLLIFSQVLRFANIAYYDQFFKNIVTIAEIALMWLGISFLSYLMDKKGVPVIFRVIILVTAMILPFTSIFLPIVGVLEFIFKFRDRDKTNREVL
ncbi:MAG: DUF2232 domain-containing protein [Tissierellia bacterium]|nr:DUF2232 domain-containing protein [Tissierellia bacterium]